MYSLSVSRSFVAQHYLTVPDPGAEGETHSHHFTVETTFEAPTLDEYGYVLDVDALEAALDETFARFRDELLNELPGFEGMNPSAERLARNFGDELLARVDASNATELTVAVQEDDVATAAHTRDL
ncbi:6-pyruvoyl trahydropterin synthase family protein [Halopenitus persicus]|uniref:6-pyruvoyltetrahydropterin/6-carboxytetrahydropterin synthase n=1 Tax=Halopenitus persicus TaxID=1048396 RepID=A0A1H3FE68_9EURY|nr:6-carboxytetrahydropterin synthase [Halopenitus persicus]SDX89175.1 6-pyruvoyltetrahydropterin/6-carboxytetrahydropterin synthase [Halopenitus persicus]